MDVQRAEGQGLINAGTVWYSIPVVILEAVRRTGSSGCHNGGMLCTAFAVNFTQNRPNYRTVTHQMRFPSSKCTNIYFIRGSQPLGSAHCRKSLYLTLPRLCSRLARGYLPRLSFPLMPSTPLFSAPSQGPSWQPPVPVLQLKHWTTVSLVRLYIRKPELV